MPENECVDLTGRPRRAPGHMQRDLHLQTPICEAEEYISVMISSFQLRLHVNLKWEDDPELVTGDEAHEEFA